jgi:hypothetical protein
MLGGMKFIPAPRFSLILASLLAAASLLAPAALRAGSAFDDLLGKWVRPDGGYELVVNSVAADGKAEVGYFNPNPIRVGEAKAETGEGGTTLFVKFDDVNYPGSTYKLKLTADKKRLEGEYFQAVQKLTYPIYFERPE